MKLRVLVLLLATAGVAGAQPSDDQIGELAPFLVLFPSLRKLPAPAFLTPGLRVSYQTGAAVIGGGASGAGVVQYDVVESDGVQVLAYQTSYGNDGAGSYPLASTAAAGLPGIGPFWLNPTVLTNAESVAGGDLSVTRHPGTFAGKNVNVVRFQTGSQSVFEFDAETGLLVFDSQSAGTSLAQTTVLGVRTLAIPWARARAPNWVRVPASLTYQGTKSTTVPAAGTVRQALALAMQVTRAGARWSVTSIATTLDGVNQGTGAGITGEAQLLGAIWVPRSALTATIGADVRIDSDPITGAEVHLARGDRGEIVLQEVTPVARTTWVYDGTLGVLLRLVQAIQTPAALLEVDVSLTGGSDLNALAQMPELPEDPAPGTAAAGDDGGGCAVASAVRAPKSSRGALLLVLLLVSFMHVSRRRRPGCPRLL